MTLWDKSLQNRNSRIRSIKVGCSSNGDRFGSWKISDDNDTRRSEDELTDTRVGSAGLTTTILASFSTRNAQFLDDTIEKTGDIPMFLNMST